MKLKDVTCYAPMIGHEPILWATHLRIYEVYSKKFGTSQSAERISERGGFAVEEADKFYPEWRNDNEELELLRKEVKELREENKNLKQQLELSTGY